MNTVNEVAAPSNKDALFKIAFHNLKWMQTMPRSCFGITFIRIFKKGVRQAFCRTPFFGKMF
ncbi:hypothetical protein A6E74_01305 [Enterococcus thailandicus]|uniref:Uncharacterized protein n=1 Tax=Enterococcus thailandicus TaxID=417368 RepID=A0A179EUZ6_ENTTH|nr:hypothetical protein A6E74_01305 [Enterococcus thailandicus]